MKMPTLRDSSRNKSSCPVCRRAFSERSRWLAVFRCGFAAFLLDLVLNESKLSSGGPSASFRERSERDRRRTKAENFLFALARRVGAFIGAPFRWLSVMFLELFPKTDSKGGALANLCFLSFRQERQGPPRPEGHALRQQNPCGIAAKKKGFFIRIDELKWFFRRLP